MNRLLLILNLVFATSFGFSQDMLSRYQKAEKYSPDKKKIAFVENNNIYIKDIESGELIKQVTNGDYFVENLLGVEPPYEYKIK